MSGKRLLLCLSLAAVPLLCSCAGRNAEPAGITYPATDKVESVFQRAQVPEQCRVFAQFFVTMPAQQTGQQFADAVAAEAKAKGADMLLIGQSRQSTSSSELTYSKYGPDREYKIGDWPGWNFGYEEWQKQGAWANIGYGEWGNPKIHFDYPVVIQLVFLRCRS